MKPVVYGEKALRVILLMSVMLMICAIGGYYLIKKYYPQIRSYTTTRHASAAFEKGDWEKACQFALLAIRQDPKNGRAIKILSQIARHFELSSTVEWQQRLVEVQPGIFQNEYLLALDALKSGQMNTVKNLIAKWSADKVERMEVYHVESIFEFQNGNLDKATSAAEKACEWSPQDSSLSFDLLHFYLLQGRSEEDPRMSSLLDKLDTGSNRVRVARMMREQAVSTRAYQRAYACSLAVLQDPSANAGDRIAHMRILEASGPAKAKALAAYFDSVQKEARGDAAFAARLGHELLSFPGLEKFCEPFFDSLPAPIRSFQAVQFVEAEYLRRSGEARKLIRLLEKSPWDKYDAIRLTYLAEAYRQIDRKDLFLDFYHRIYSRLEKQPGLIPVIYVPIENWGGWGDEALDFLWLAIEKAVYTEWAYQKLARHYRGQRDTGQLLLLSRMMLKIHPESAAIRNNEIMCSLLLGKDESAAHQKALKLYREYPKHPVIISTYCFSLYLKGRFREAVTLFETLDKRTRSSPAFAFYDFIFLDAAGYPEKAALAYPHIDEAALLPEEKEMLKSTSFIKSKESGFSPPEATPTRE